MIVTELRLLVFVLGVFLSAIVAVDGVAGRCYLCAQHTLPACIGSARSDSTVDAAQLQFYTEPCNGQCVLFRNENNSVIRGCSWTYGQMESKSTGWHDLTAGVRAYFCDGHLCNNGIIEQPEVPIIKPVLTKYEHRPPPQTINNAFPPFIVPGSRPAVIRFGQRPPPDPPILLRQCYSCTSRHVGCGEFLDARYVVRYVRPCPTSCIVFRNPNDHNILTRDCSVSWPKAQAKSGLQKLLGSDAFFCQESLCNGVNFDFILGIFHNQLPAVISFTPAQTLAAISTTTTSTATTTEDNRVVWEDPELDFIIAEAPTTTIVMTTTTTRIQSSLSAQSFERLEAIAHPTTTPFDALEHLDLVEEMPSSSTIAGGLAVAEEDSEFNWWDLNETSFPPAIATAKSRVVTTTEPVARSEDDDWVLFNATYIPWVTRFEHLSGDEETESPIDESHASTTPLPLVEKESNGEVEIDLNDYFVLSTSKTVDFVNENDSFVPYYFSDYKTTDKKDDFFDLVKPVPTLAMPPFDWMLHQLNNPSAEVLNRKSDDDPKPDEKRRPLIRANKTVVNDYDYCDQKQCHHGGRLNIDCLCICLPAFTGDNCETVLCDQEPGHICDFVLEAECNSDYVRYLCPKYCRTDICSPPAS